MQAISTNTSESAICNSSVRLPMYNHPSFNGNCSVFDNFWTRFDTIISKNPSFSVLEKFEFLLGQLSGHAYQVVSHLDFREEHFEAPYTLLKERFSNPRRVLSFHANGLLNLPAFQRKEFNSQKKYSTPKTSIEEKIKQL